MKIDDDRLILHLDAIKVQGGRECLQMTHRDFTESILPQEKLLRRAGKHT